VKTLGDDTDGDGDPDNLLVVHDGQNPDEWTPSGALAVVIAPGMVLQRQNENQDRSGGDGRCSSSIAPACLAVNYLDLALD